MRRQNITRVFAVLIAWKPGKHADLEGTEKNVKRNI